MYEITDVTRDYLFVRIRLRNVQTGETRDWEYWDDLEEWLCEEYGVKNLKGVVLKKTASLWRLGLITKNIENMEKDQIIYDKRKAMGESIRAMRTAQGWEQEQLAQIAGITPANVRSVEAGKYAVNIDVLNKIAGALGAELLMVEK